MKYNIYEKWLKKEMIGKCRIVKAKKGGVASVGFCFKSVFNGAPFYESWTDEEAVELLNGYLDNNANILVPYVYDEPVGFLVSTDKIPEEQQEYITYPLDNIRYVEEIGILKEFRSNNIASELVRYDLLNAINLDKKYLAYRTNSMRYFRKDVGESFESALERVQLEDKIARSRGDKIVVPKLDDSEKQEFINNYLTVLEKRPDLDVSCSNKLFRDLFGKLEFSKDGYNYTWQKDPTGENNDRIFPIIDLEKRGFVKTKYNSMGVR